MVYAADPWQRVVNVSWAGASNQFYTSTDYPSRLYGHAFGDPGTLIEYNRFAPSTLPGSVNAYALVYVMQGGAGVAEEPIDFEPGKTLADMRGARLTADVGGGSISWTDDSYSLFVTTSNAQFWTGGSQFGASEPIDSTQYGRSVILQSAFFAGKYTYVWQFLPNDFASSNYNDLVAAFPQSTPTDQRTLRVTWP